MPKNSCKACMQHVQKRESQVCSKYTQQNPRIRKHNAGNVTHSGVHYTTDLSVLKNKLTIAFQMHILTELEIPKHWAIRLHDTVQLRHSICIHKLSYKSEHWRAQPDRQPWNSTPWREARKVHQSKNVHWSHVNLQIQAVTRTFTNSAKCADICMREDIFPRCPC